VNKDATSALSRLWIKANQKDRLTFVGVEAEIEKVDRRKLTNISKKVQSKKMLRSYKKRQM